MANIKVVPAAIEPVLIVEVEWFGDKRGFIMESYQKRRYLEQGIAYEFVQDIHSRSAKNVVRGFHYQDGSAPMAKLVRCTVGALLDVVVDLRVGSPTFGSTFSIELSAENKKQLLVPPEFGHGFCALTDVCEMQYKVSNYYTPSAEGAVAWNDPEIGFAWPVTDPILSRRDRDAPSLAAYRQQPAFLYPPSAART